MEDREKTSQIMLSVHMITYNHERYITEAIEGVLMQKTTFPFELIISDDSSTDSTGQIIKEYAERLPGIINPILREMNIGSTLNFYDTFSYCKGKYIALCEGDDYWTDPLKLQKQVDFLENNSEYSICYHRVEELYDDGKIILERLNTSENEEIYSIRDLARRNIMHTPSVMFQNHAGSLPKWLAESPVGDYPLHLLNARYGKIKYFPQTMAVYRVHNTSRWSSQSRFNRIKTWLKVLKYLIIEFKNEKDIKEVLLLQLLANYEELYDMCVKDHDMAKLASITKEVLQDIPDFLDLWYDHFYKGQIDLALDYPAGINKSARHLVKQISRRLKKE